MVWTLFKVLFTNHFEPTSILSSNSSRQSITCHVNKYDQVYLYYHHIPFLSPCFWSTWVPVPVGRSSAATCDHGSLWRRSLWRTRRWADLWCSSLAQPSLSPWSHRNQSLGCTAHLVLRSVKYIVNSWRNSSGTTLHVSIFCAQHFIKDKYVLWCNLLWLSQSAIISFYLANN